MADDKTKFPKPQETTSRLILKDTFDEDDVTMVDELQEPDFSPEINRREASITEKLPNPKAEVAKKIKQLPEPRKSPEQNAILPQKSGFWRAISKKTVIAIAIIFILASFIWILSISITRHKKGSLIEPDATKALSRNIPLNFSKAEFLDLNDNVISDKNIPLNDYFIMSFHVLSWDARKDEKLDLTADIRIYSQKNQLLLFLPEFLKYSGEADMKKETILVKTKIRFGDQSEPGFYRILVTVKESGTQRQNSIQARIRLVK